MYKSFLVKYGEIGVKGKNRYIFENMLMEQIRHALKTAEGEFEVTKEQGRIYVNVVSDDYDYDETVEALSRVFGIVGFCPLLQVEDEGFDKLAETVVDYLGKEYPEKNFTFKVNARRARKNYPLDSMEINAELGGKILDAFPESKVDVHNPDITVTVEVRDRYAFVRGNNLHGAGGMPTGTGGRAAVLISGGIDSPVASYMMAKRGIELVAVHFASPPYTSELAEMKVMELLKKVARYSGWITTFVVPFTEIQEQIRDKCPEEYFTIIMRRVMMMISARIAGSQNCHALITGESVGQVASQTMYALACTDLSLIHI